MPDNTLNLKAIRARLDRWELTHLRTLAASLHEQLENAELRADNAERMANSAEHAAEFWQANAMELQADLVRALGGDAAPGITQDGDLVVVQHPAQPVAATASQPPAVGQHWPEQGGLYLGIAPAEGDLPQRHLVALLEHASTAPMKWQPAMAHCLAVGNGARAPTQLEAMLAYTVAKTAFRPKWHWTSTQVSSDYAVAQDFEDGNSGWYSKNYEFLVLPVRGLTLETFTHLVVASDNSKKNSDASASAQVAE